MDNETFFNLLLPHLSLDVVYRLYPFSSVLRRMVDNRNYWLKLIERDLKMVPKFEINPKLYYLRLMNYPIAGSLMSAHPLTNSLPVYHLYKDNKVVQYLEGAILYRHNKIEYKGRIISFSESIKFLRVVVWRPYVISYSGKVYDLEAVDPNIPMDIFGSDVLDISTITSNASIKTVIVITHQGGVKLFNFTNDASHLVVGSFDISTEVDSKVVQLHNDYIMTENGDLYIVDPYIGNLHIYVIKRMCGALLSSPFFLGGINHDLY